jgi:hypothetical protein
MSSKEIIEKEHNNQYEVGQIWEYETRTGEEKSTLTIVNIEKNKLDDTIINVYINNLKIKNLAVKNGISDTIQHLPFGKKSIDNSVTKLIGFTKILPDYNEGFNEWKSLYDIGEAGIFDQSTIKETIDLMEITLNQ